MLGTLEESSIDCLDEGCNGRVAKALVYKFCIVCFVSLWVGEAGSFNIRVARCTVGALGLIIASTGVVFTILSRVSGGAISP